jgi:hypothetical protein
MIRRRPLTKAVRTLGQQKIKSRPGGATAFLDTSVFVMHHFGTALQKKEVARTVGSMRRVTAAYCFTEIKNYICNLINLYFAVEEERDVNEALKLISNSMRIRERGAMMQLVAVADMTICPTIEQQLFAIADAIFSYLDVCYDYISERIDNGLKCPLADVEFSEDPEMRTSEIFRAFLLAYHCEVDEPKQCDQDEFLADNREKVDLIATGGTLKSPGALRARKLIDELATGKKKHLRGLNARCNKIGDVLIALQCASGATLVTSDNTFKEYAALFGFNCTVIPSAQALRKADRQAEQANDGA